ncbi:LysM peptidoglycan-binding domain-containing protein [Vulgatibacter sp.]|uniref:LysM peptidoglycan-binding domain-containing protein n=1 Tax=Vulgatibacter sp. TaxID=1971226 RepID=UPI003562A759
MRRSLALVAILAVSLPGAAAAQEAAQPPAEGGPSEVDHLPVAGDETPRDFGGAPDDVVPSVSGDTHTVERGDTLWDISGKYLENPWYWPKVWSFNPQIENPHWIYPGDEIRLQQDDGAAPAGGPMADLSKGDFTDPGSDDVSVAGRIGVQLPKNLLAPTAGFVTEQELAESGVLAKSWEEKALLMEGDRIYVAWQDAADQVEVGNTYVIYRTDREVSHPEEGGTVGYLTRVLGTARVVDAKPNADYVTAVIVRSLSEIERGDRIGPVAGELSHRVSRVSNRSEVDAFILATLEENLAELGQGHLVFLDKGSEDGLVAGNTLDVIRAGDGLEDDGYTPHFDEELPVENIGSLMVVDVKERTAAALVVRSIRELRIGDRVEMRVAAN